MNDKRIGFGGGCHWCTEAVFASFMGNKNVQQGWISSATPNGTFSEAVIVTYQPAIFNLKDLIHVHLLTHASTSNHSMRNKYRSAIYWFNKEDEKTIQLILDELQQDFHEPLVTLVLPFVDFKASLPQHQNYYYSDPDKPFCQLYIHPKLKMLREKFKHLAIDGPPSL